MKKYLLINFLIVVFGNLFAQNNFKEFAPIGATWYYDREQMVEYEARGYGKYTVESDTIIGSKIMKIVSRYEVDSDSIVTSWDNYFIYTENSKVFQLVDNELVLVYDFTLMPGDTMGVKVVTECDSVTPIVLDSIGEIIIDNDTLKVQYLSFYQRYFDDEIEFEKITFEITEKVGSISDFLYIPNCKYETPWTSISLRCYTDSEIQYVERWWRNTYPDADCDEIINNTSVQTNMDINIKTYPNPVIDFLNLDFHSESLANTYIEIFNIYGEKLITMNNCSRIDMQQIQAGVYLLIVSNDKDRKVIKIIKN